MATPARRVPAPWQRIFNWKPLVLFPQRKSKLQSVAAGELWVLAHSPHEGNGNDFNLAGRESAELSKGHILTGSLSLMVIP